MIGGETGYSDSVAQGITNSYAFTVPSGTGNVAVTLWWPERWDNSRSSNQYHQSKMELDLLRPNGQLLAGDGAPTGVFKHMILDATSNSIIPGTYIAEVTGNVVDSFPRSTTQPFYLWITPLPSAF